jgi:hypothetical protein
MLAVNPLENILKTRITVNTENTKAVKTVVSELAEMLASLIYHPL